MQATSALSSRQSTIIATNIHWLRQALRLLERLDDTVYSATAPGFAPHRAGSHLRHVLELYQCFLEGLDSSHIDYDSRRRDEAIEVSRDTASVAIRSVIGALETRSGLREEQIVWVRMEDAEATGVRDSFMQSSVSRELQVLSSHTVHHFALIAVTLRAHGIQMDLDFGRGAVHTSSPGIESCGGCIMCTVSWVHQPDGYHLLCNRDEKRTRGPAFAPRVAARDGVRYIAPIDSDCGGTWLATNEFGLSVCLLNGSPVFESPGPRRSRGSLIREVAWAPSADECVLGLRHLDLRPFAAFSLVILEPGRTAILAQWDGCELAVDPNGDSHMPLTSSSYDAEGVRRSRLNDCARRVRATGSFDPALLYWFHSSHSAKPDAYSTCMHRADAQTVSFSWVIVSKDAIRFLYLPGAPCQSKPSEQQMLVRAA